MQERQHTFASSKCVLQYNDDNNLCFWAAYAAYRIVQDGIQKYVKTEKQQKKGMNKENLTPPAKMFMREYYNKPSLKPKHYPGFNIATELESFVRWSGVDTNIYTFDDENKKFVLFKTVTLRDVQASSNDSSNEVSEVVTGGETDSQEVSDACEHADENKTCENQTGENKTCEQSEKKTSVCDDTQQNEQSEHVEQSERPPFNILLLTSGERSHIMFIKKIVELTGVLICPKCHSYCYNPKGTNRNKKRFDEHVKNCKGKPEKRLKLENVSHPYCPHLWKTPYAKLIVSKEEDYWKPTSYFMTYDFETMEEKCEQVLTEQTILNSKILPLSVSLTVYSQKGINTYWFSARHSNANAFSSKDSNANVFSSQDSDAKVFIQDFIRKMFECYDEVYESNIIKTPTQTILPKHVCVLGYNSGKFDMNILLPYLTSTVENWNVTDLVGTMSNFKSLTLSNGQGKKLTFLDALLLSL